MNESVNMWFLLSCREISVSSVLLLVSDQEPGLKSLPVPLKSLEVNLIRENDFQQFNYFPVMQK